MSRTKQVRKLTFNPLSTRFSPSDKRSSETITLLHDELEALYLMDYLDQYQEECAKSMGISRPTFSRIIKDARKKVAQMIVLGKNLEITKESIPSIIAFATDDKHSVADLIIAATYFAFATVKDGEISSISFKDNPIRKEFDLKGADMPIDGAGLGAGRIIPPLLKEASVFVCKEIGDGLKRNLEGVGVRVEVGKFTTLSDIEKII